MSKITSFGILKAIHNFMPGQKLSSGVVKDHIFWNSESNSQLGLDFPIMGKVVKDHIFWNSESNSQQDSSKTATVESCQRSHLLEF
ncbi:hypothetical protein BST97_06685 [Nonlabens spongiae]|uniref:Uncharacterized protein n=1 Tax=Nonlabens spongiae TaxID=331648 RepID=A0A1W6MJB7_9FLAO|nr:hypothetical protein BST97_06685 [Nonlabens spongiae]